jgi:hypothetical protein
VPSLEVNEASKAISKFLDGEHKLELPFSPYLTSFVTGFITKEAEKRYKVYKELILI